MSNRVFAAIAVLSLACAANAAIPYERGVTAPVYGVPPAGRGLPAIASDGDGALLAWTDSARGAIYAARMNADGSVPDGTGTRIATGNASAPWLFWSGAAYALFWSEVDGVHFVELDRFANAGAPRLANPHFYATSMASNGTRVVAAGNNTLAVFDLGGHLIESGIVIPGADERRPSTVTSNGRGFLVTYGLEDWSLHAVALDASGRLAGPARFIAAPVHPDFSPLASNGDEYLVVLKWDNVAMRSQRIAADGTPLATVPLQFPVSIPTARLSWTGSDYLLTWTQFDEPPKSGRISAIRFDPVFPALHATADLVGLGGAHAIAPLGGSFVLAWLDAAGGVSAEIVAPASLTHSEPVLVSRSAPEQRTPRIAFSGRNHLVVWQEAKEIRATRIDDDGRALDSSPLRMGSNAANPSVVFDGEAFVVAWQQNVQTGPSLWLARIDPGSGAPIGNAVKVPTLAMSYDVAGAGEDGTLIVFEDVSHRLQALRVDHALQPVGTPLAITPASMVTRNPSIAWNGAQWLVAFEEQIREATTIPEVTFERDNLRAVRLAPSMTILDTEPIAVALTDRYNQAHQQPHAASNGHDFLIAWSYTESLFVTDEPAAKTLFARQLLPDGTLGKPLPLGAGAATSALWAGSTYAIGYISPVYDALGITPTGARFEISATADTEPSLALAYANGRITGAYARVATEPLYGGVSRAFVRDAHPLHGRAAAH